MRLTCYLMVSHSGSVSLRKYAPDPGAVRAGQLVLPLTVDIPDRAFAVYLDRAEITVPESERFQAAVELVDPEAHP